MSWEEQPIYGDPVRHPLVKLHFKSQNLDFQSSAYLSHASHPMSINVSVSSLQHHSVQLEPAHYGYDD